MIPPWDPSKVLTPGEPRFRCTAARRHLVVGDGGSDALEEGNKHDVHHRVAPAEEVGASLLAKLPVDFVHPCDEVTLPLLVIPAATKVLHTTHMLEKSCSYSQACFQVQRLVRYL